MLNYLLRSFLVSCLLLVGCQKSSLTVYVSPDGSDTNPGTEQQPFATVEHAQKMVLSEMGKRPVTILFREGTYYLSEPIRLENGISGSRKNPIKYSSYPGEKAVLSGAAMLSGLQWSDYKNGIKQAQVSTPLVFDQLYVNGRKMPMARYPNYDPDVRHYNGYAADAISPERVKGWDNPQGGYIHALHIAEWGGYQYQIAGKDEEGNLHLDGGFQNNRQMGMHITYRMVENIFEELDTEGEWFFDSGTNTLYFYPPKDIDLTTATIEVPQLESLFVLTGTEKLPVRHVEISNLELTHTVRTFMKTKEPLLRSDWTIYRNGVIRMEGTENCTVEGCALYNAGGNGIFFSNYNRYNRVEECHIHDVGASGICFVGSPDAVRSPSFEYGQAVPLAELDLEPGPKGNNYPARCTVHNNLIHNVGQVEKQIAGVQLSISRNITVSQNSIYNLPRAGINISEGTWGGHLIEWNDVFNTVLETGDHGSINAWGRDRFWHPNRELMDSITAVHPELIGLDALETTIIRNNRWRCDHGWDIDLDDGASNYHLYNNLCLNGGIKLREGFNRIVENNISVNNSFHSHAWFENSGDLIRHNIWTRRYYPIGIENWGEETDYNLFPDTPALEQARANGTDMHSVAGDPLFVSPETGDYQVRENSPALEIGFKNFPMDRFGVQEATLKALAATPELPVFEMPVWVPAMDEIYRWQGASLKNIVTEGERSAAGLDSARGLFVIGMEPESAMAASGIKINDVVLGCNGIRTDNWEILKNELDKACSGQNVEINFYRHQHHETATVNIP